MPVSFLVFCVSKWPITCPEPETLEPVKCFFRSISQPVVTVWSLEFKLCKVISQFCRLNVLLQKLAELCSSDSSGLRGEQKRAQKSRHRGDYRLLWRPLSTFHLEGRHERSFRSQETTVQPLSHQSHGHSPGCKAWLSEPNTTSVALDRE